MQMEEWIELWLLLRLSPFTRVFVYDLVMALRQNHVDILEYKLFAM
jgi:hypothetical protein